MATVAPTTAGRVAPRRDAVLARLRAGQSQFEAMGVKAMFLFGSLARDDATEGSDIDVFIEIAEESKFSLLDLVRVGRWIEDNLGRKCDIMTRQGINRHRRPFIEHDAIAVF